VFKQIVAVYCGICAEQGKSLWGQDVEVINAKAGGMYSNLCFVI
jgi:hypothetical protein